MIAPLATVTTTPLSSDSYPLLQGLLARLRSSSHDASSSSLLVRNVVERFDAGCRIARWGCQMWSRHRHGAAASLPQSSKKANTRSSKKRKLDTAPGNSANSKSKKKRKGKGTDTSRNKVEVNVVVVVPEQRSGITPSRSWKHWSLDAIAHSPSLLVRQSVARILLLHYNRLKGLTKARGTLTLKSYSNRDTSGTLIKILLHLASERCFCEGDVQIFGVLEHILTDGAGDQSSMTLMMKQFLCQGGLRWIARQMLMLSMTSASGSTAFSSSHGHVAASRTRWSLLIHLLQVVLPTKDLIWTSTTPAYAEPSSSTKINLSPLACLLLAAHQLQDETSAAVLLAFLDPSGTKKPAHLSSSSMVDSLLEGSSLNCATSIMAKMVRSGSHSSSSSNQHSVASEMMHFEGDEEVEEEEIVIGQPRSHENEQQHLTSSDDHGTKADEHNDEEMEDVVDEDDDDDDDDDEDYDDDVVIEHDDVDVDSTSGDHLHSQSSTGLQELSQATDSTGYEDTAASASLTTTRAASGSQTKETNIASSIGTDERKEALLRASLQVLTFVQFKQKGHCAPSWWSPLATDGLLQAVCHAVKPPKKPLNLKLFLRRAPSQEEFFRGSLSRNPVPLTTLAEELQTEPTMRDLRQFIANDLQMSESAELLELLVANKIVSMDLKVRVVHQVVWRNHLMENSSSSAAAAAAFLSSASGGSTMGLSLLSSSFERSISRQSITSETPLSALPPMVITYRLAGVDGEATEDQVDTLVDPEEPQTAATDEERERFMEREFGLTRLVTEDRSNITVLVKSVQTHVQDRLRAIRRDDAARIWRQRSINKLRKSSQQRSEQNRSLAAFLVASPCSALTLLKHTTQLSSNRKKLVDARAPTILLRLLLDVLNTIDDDSAEKKDTKAATTGTNDQAATVVTNPTAELLEELIETLASDISTEDDTSEDDDEDQQGASTLPLLLSSLKTIYLGPPLRKVIAKLLPFLTYGQVSLSKELAENFVANIALDSLAECEITATTAQQITTRKFVMMDTFVQAAVNLPPTSVCHSLRAELIKCGFVKRLVLFVMVGLPTAPPPWTTALSPKQASHPTKKEGTDAEILQAQWKTYFARKGVKTAFEMLVGVCRGHIATQNVIGEISLDEGTENSLSFLEMCHWIESTSDNRTAGVQTHGLGILAETLLDELKEEKTDVSSKIGAIRCRTRERKKELAQERRRRALGGMGAAFSQGSNSAPTSSSNPSSAGMGESLRSGLTLLSNLLGGGTGPASSACPSRAEESKTKKVKQPAWLAEVEALEDEKGLTCAVCQEGRTLQPSEILGLYAYIRKISIHPGKCGQKVDIDGSVLLATLTATSLPPSLKGSQLDSHWYQPALAAGLTLKDHPDVSSSYKGSGISGSSRRTNQFTTTVSAGNAIHCSCHARAKSADRNHPKAPKSEWEGASLRNSRVACNVILPLVSSESSKVPLVAVDLALTDYQNMISNLLGARPKTMLWVVLHDVRLVLLRIAYGEPLNSDCGGGSLASNTSLLFYQLFLADMFSNDADHDSPSTARHARNLSGGFLAAHEILDANDYDGKKATVLCRGLAESAPMAALCCILYNNVKDEKSAGSKNTNNPHPRRRWELQKEKFLDGLISCAGRRHALGVEDSGCLSTRGGKGSRLAKSSAFVNWESETDEKKRSSSKGKRSQVDIDDFGLALRPMIALYAIFDIMSEVFVVNLGDELVEERSGVIVSRIEDCYRARNIQELLQVANVNMPHNRIIEFLQKGMVSA